MTFQILSQIAQNTNKIFCSNNNHNISYEQLLRAISNDVHWLTSKKISNQKIVLQLEHNIRSQIFFLAALHCNDVLLASGHTDYATKFVREQGFGTVLTTASLPELDLTSTHGLPRKILRKGSCFMLSSGTTGHPKIIQLRYDELIRYGRGLEYFFKICPRDRFYNVVPFYHGFGLTRLFTIIFTGSSQTIPAKVVFDEICADVNRNHCTWISFVPRMIRLLNHKPKKFWDGYRFATASASLIDKDNHAKFEEWSGRPLFVEYGCTEAGIISSNNFESSILGSLGKACMPIDVRGYNLWVCPPWAQGRWIDTGDMIEVRNDHLWLLGRSKEIIKKNGKTIFPIEIESLIARMEGVDEVVIYARSAMTDRESIGLIYTGEASTQQVKQYCDSYLDPILRPDHIFRCDSIPYHNGKIRRQYLQNYVDTQQ